MKLSVVFFGFAFVAASFEEELATSKKQILGAWYCPSADIFHRFEFSSDATLMWSSYVNGRWSMNYVDRMPYTVSSPSEVSLGPTDKMRVHSLNTSEFQVEWSGTKYTCARTRPAGDTDAPRAEVAKAEEREKQAFVGKWASADGAKLAEFVADGACEVRTLDRGKWVTTRDKFRVNHEGYDSNCGLAGIFIKNGVDALTFTYAMRDVPIPLRRVRRVQ